MAGPPKPLSTRDGKNNRRAITLANPSQPVPTPSLEPALVQRPSKASKRTREREPPRQRPYLFEYLRASLPTTRIVADTLDWDVLMYHGFDATVLSLDVVFKGLKHDRETYYLLWVAVRKVLAEEPGTDLTGSHRYQKTRHMDELLDAVLEQFLAELGNALLEFVDGTHCTILDPRKHSDNDDDDPRVILAKARSLVARFEKLGRDRRTIMVAIPATEAGIVAAASLQWEHGINVNLTSVSGVMHAAACAQAGAAAVTIPVGAIRDWHRDRGRTNREEYTGADSDDAIENAQTIAAYFRQHGISSTELFACNLDHVDDACSLAALGALSFDADQARAAEWYAAYPNVPRTIPDSAVRRAASFPTPPPLGEGDPACTLRRMDGAALSAFSAVVYTALGGARETMSMIADIAMREIDWQLALLRPMYIVVPHSSPDPPGPQSADADKVVVQQPEPRNCLKRKRKCRAPEALLLRVPETPPAPRKRFKLASDCTVPERSETPPPADSRNEEAADEGSHDGGRLWQRLAIGERHLPPSSEESTTAVDHAREEEVPEFGKCRRARSNDGERSAANGGGEEPPKPHGDSDFWRRFEPQARTAPRPEPGHP